MNWVFWFLLGGILALSVWANAADCGKPPAWFEKKVAKFNATNASDRALSSYHFYYSSVGAGYISQIGGWASWGLCDKAGKTIVRVWKLPQASSARCVKSAHLPYGLQVWDYGNECN